MKQIKDIELTPEKSLDKKFVELCKSVTKKRSKAVIAHILLHGFITTDEITEKYNYSHAPRAARDVRENGIPLKTYRVKSEKTGKSISAYTFYSKDNIRRGRIGGRKAFSKQFKQELLDKYGSRDAFTNVVLHQRYLQIDHRVPYEVAGENDGFDVNDYMLIDASSQRAKSWSCEHCENFSTTREELCKKCFWASPESYTHIALKEERRIDIVWSGAEVALFDSLKKYCQTKSISVQDYIKTILRK